MNGEITAVGLLDQLLGSFQLKIATGAAFMAEAASVRAPQDEVFK
jgi:hypothetical protein